LKHRLQLWLAGLTLTFFALAIVAGAWAFAIALLPGWLAVAAVAVVAAALSVSVGRALRWLAQG
jgi:hypothetical protein